MNPRNLQTESLKNLRPLPICYQPLRIGMHVSFYLEHQFQFCAKEIHYEAPDKMLSAKLITQHLSISNQCPDSPFGRGLSLPKALG
jgi:hypothetical protein